MFNAKPNWKKGGFLKVNQVGLKNFARYESGQVIQGRAMDLLLRVFDFDPAITKTPPGGIDPFRVMVAEGVLLPLENSAICRFSTAMTP